MHADKTILLKLEKSAKLPIGPTSEKPGPMLLTIDNTDEKVVIKSKSSSDTKITAIIIIKIYEKKKVKMLFSVSSLIDLVSIFIVWTELG